MCNAEPIAKSFIVPELTALNKVFRTYTGQNFLKSSDKKDVKINRISEKFGDQSVLKHENKSVKNLKSLKDIAFKLVSGGQVPKAVIVTNVARIKQEIKLHKWKKNATVPMQMKIKHKNENFNFYSFPEYSNVHNQLEPRTLDPTHILTNLRAHACWNGFSFFNKNAFIHVSEVKKNI